jgi:uncharacterized protein YaeQ
MARQCAFLYIAGLTDRARQNQGRRPHFMALKATIFKADLQVADMDRHYYGDHALTIARHPSETDERMMVRLLAFALHANEALVFGKGLSTDDEPDLWQKDLTGAIDLWIDVGQPDERRLLKACGRSTQVVVYSYSSTSNIWWNQVAGKLERARNLRVVNLPSHATTELARLAQRTMQLQCTIQDGQIWIANGEQSVHLEPEKLKDMVS